MSEHYYTRRPSIESAREQMTIHVRKRTMQLYTDRGVFSKGELDAGSRLLIETFQFPNIVGNVLDVGCGYGPIGLTLAKEDTTRTVHLVDVNERAIQLATDNATLNDVTNVEIYESDTLKQVEGKFASIVTNPPIRAGKQTVFAIYEQSFEKLVDGGTLWVVIQKKQGAPSTKKKLQSMFTTVEVVAKQSGYFIFKATKN